ncbi:response regulator [Oscillatoriales cyanobacterium LEGE 11467]|uniref:Circadian input-output histidine kinase CikA n=1 Tax=Zarconia navalis LEGE 11467 TaxID=1828826 RepID=A0A928Z6X8_9CYAN|nr:response regulator [Zarconia navalis]MBE9040867.1 response regulator [Zarconia navalis LEGE 11467]
MDEIQKTQVLIVDDTPTNIQVLSDFLIESGFEVLVAKNGESALRKLEKAAPDIILLDIMMPGINGFETCIRLKDWDKTKDIPIIFMTALSDVVDKVKGLSLGAVDYITKPFQQEEVLARINVQLRLRNLTRQLQLAKQEADAANQSKSEFLTNMSHDLRTPLNGILGVSQMLLSSPNIPTEELDNINIIYQSGSHLLTLINDILDISKIESGKMELDRSKFSLANFLKRVVEICQVRAKQKKIFFRYQPDSSLPMGIHADEKRVRQILINLLGNAIKFTETGGVTFIVKNLGSATALNNSTLSYRKLRFQIEDTGIGMKPESLQKIFLPFEQAKNPRYNNEGTGLGLAISQKLIQMMGSTLHVKSQPGKGSIFWTDLDIEIAVEAIEPLEPTSKPPSIVDESFSRQLPLRILLVEDTRINQKVALRMLKRLGYQADLATNGLEALEVLRRESYDIVFMDVQMPQMDGFEATRQIHREWKALERPWIIAMTANAMRGDREKCLEAGMNDYISKPVEVEEIARSLRQYSVTGKH